MRTVTPFRCDWSFCLQMSKYILAGVLLNIFLKNIRFKLSLGTWQKYTHFWKYYKQNSKKRLIPDIFSDTLETWNKPRSNYTVLCAQYFVHPLNCILLKFQPSLFGYNIKKTLCAYDWATVTTFLLNASLSDSWQIFPFIVNDRAYVFLRFIQK